MDPLSNICTNFDQVGQVDFFPLRKYPVYYLRFAASGSQDIYFLKLYISQAFASHYYNIFDTDRGQIGQLYKVIAT